ncbi:hypothetical protein Csa_003027 [Cucumis sativus]|nr:hypothetical protein Csa_003027 [Cucumis sativus]
MRSLRYVIFLVFFFYFALVAHGRATSNGIVVGSIKSFNLGRSGCQKVNVECEKGDGRKENVFEHEDYVYTQSLP